MKRTALYIGFPYTAGLLIASVVQWQLWYGVLGAVVLLALLLLCLCSTAFAASIPGRQQIAAILYRYAAWKGYDTTARGDLSGYPDQGTVASWARDALSWAVAEKLLNGTTKTGSSAVILDPDGEATRAQVATILMRFLSEA